MDVFILVFVWQMMVHDAKLSIRNKSVDPRLLNEVSGYIYIYIYMCVSKGAWTLSQDDADLSLEVWT